MTDTSIQKQAVIDALRGAQKKSGKLVRLEDLVFESFLNEEGLENTPHSSSVYDENVERQIREVARQLVPQVQETILSGLYRMRVSGASSAFNLDDEALESLQLEVVLVLLGLQSVPEFENSMTHSPILSTDESAEFAQAIRETLFAELALYLPGMDASASPSTLYETLKNTVADDVDVQARLEKLPETVRTTVRSTELEDAFASIQKRHHIGQDVSRPLGNQIVRVMVGLTTMNDFKVSVTRVAGIPPSDLDALFLDVEQQLFKPVRTTILHALENNMGSLPTKTPSVTTGNDPYRTPIQ